MADPNLVRILREDPASWQNPHPPIRADLTGADLTGADLSGASLSGADFTHADLTEANLSSANLMSANLVMADLSRADLGNASLIQANLGGADLSSANLATANLTMASLILADLTLANLSNAVLSQADFLNANLAGAVLTEAVLVWTNLSGSDLSGADLAGASLADTNFNNTNLSGANLIAARLSSTNFGDVDLSTVIGLDAVVHVGPSTVGVDTLFRTGPGISQVFLRGCGVPASFVSYIDDLVRPVSFMHFRTFLSYSTIDNDFADRLYRSLFDDHAISTWRDVHQILPGDPLMASIDKGINEKTDKMVLICSRGSLSGESSWWTTQEIERAFKRERDHQKQTGEKLVYLIPISIDGFVFSDECTHEYKATLLERRAANFVGWESDADRYNAELKDLLNALRVKPIRPGDFDTPRA